MHWRLQWDIQSNMILDQWNIVNWILELKCSDSNVSERFLRHIFSSLIGSTSWSVSEQAILELKTRAVYGVKSEVILRGISFRGKHSTFLEKQNKIHKLIDKIGQTIHNQRNILRRRYIGSFELRNFDSESKYETQNRAPR